MNIWPIPASFCTYLVSGKQVLLHNLRTRTFRTSNWASQRLAFGLLLGVLAAYEEVEPNAGFLDTLPARLR